MVSNLDKDNSVYGPHVFFPGFRYSNPLFEESFDKFMAESNYQTVQNIVLFSQYP
jgi:protoheme ferro-lyase